MRKPQTYKQWAKQAGKIEELGSEAIFLDMILKRKSRPEAERELMDLMLPAFSKALMNTGTRPSNDITIERERDVTLPADNYVVIMKALQGDLPMEYLRLAYHVWQESYKEIEEWGNKKLCEYLLHWLYREKGSGKVANLIYELLDKLEPDWRDE